MNPLFSCCEYSWVKTIMFHSLCNLFGLSRFGMHLSIFFFFLNHCSNDLLQAKVSCEINVDIHNQTIEHQNCYPQVKLFHASCHCILIFTFIVKEKKQCSSFFLSLQWSSFMVLWASLSCIASLTIEFSGQWLVYGDDVHSLWAAEQKRSILRIHVFVLI